jgi:adenosine/AMP kinase
MDGLPHLPDLGLAVAVAHMRQNIDRRIGDEIDVVAAARQRALDIAGIKFIEKIQHALPVKILDHVFPAGWPDSHRRFYCEPNPAGINRQKFPTV